MELFFLIVTDFAEPLSFLPRAILVGGLCFGVFFLFERRNPERVYKKGKYGIWFLFFVYLSIVLDYAFFSRAPGSRHRIDLILGESWGTTARSHAYVIENVLMTVPLGAFLGVLWRARTKKGTIVRAFLVSMAASICLELAQLATGRGYCQVDDVATNAVGGLLGAIFAVHFAWRDMREEMQAVPHHPPCGHRDS